MIDGNKESREILIDQLMKLICDIRNGATIDKFRLDKDPYCYILHAVIIPKQLHEYKYVKKAIEEVKPLSEKEKEKTKKPYVDCGQCEYHNYDWDVDDGYGGDEYEICEKGHELYPKECKDFEEI